MYADFEACGDRMKSLVWLLAGLLFASANVTALVAQDASALEGLEERAFQQATALVSENLVRIETVGGLDQVEGMLVANGATTGVVVGKDGWVISSAFNFVSNPAQTIITTADGRRLPAKIVAQDKARFLTLLKVDVTDLKPARAVPLKEIRVGQWALALGRTLDAEAPSVSVGIVSAINRIWGKAVQTDAKVSPVNYGGALADVQGRVMGVLVPLSPQEQGLVAGVEWYDSGIGFAIPLEEIYANLERLQSGQDLLPGLLGIGFKTQDELAGEALIDRVRYGSPAQQAGLKPGDRIVEINGQPILRVAEFRQAVGKLYAGEKLSLKSQRGTESLSIELTLVGELVPYEFPYLGVLPERVDPERPILPGVGLRHILPLSPAQTAKLQPRDRVLSVGGRTVDTVEQLTNLMAEIRVGEVATLQVQRGDAEPITVTAKLTALPEKTPGEIPPTSIPAGPAPIAGQPAPATGLLKQKFGATGRDYWAYVPGQYHPGFEYGLVIWLHPAGDDQQAAVRDAWRATCEERGLILLAPLAGAMEGWEATDLDFIHDLVRDFQKTYKIDPRRVVLHGTRQGGDAATALALKHRDVYRGLIAVNSRMPRQLPDNEPVYRLQFFAIREGEQFTARVFEAQLQLLRSQKYPVTVRSIGESDTGYLPEELVQELARWVDGLDRI